MPAWPVLRSWASSAPSALSGVSEAIAEIAVAPSAAISGQVALDASGAVVGDKEDAAQARQCFANLPETLVALHARPCGILQMRTYLAGHRQDLVPAIFGDRARVAAGGYASPQHRSVLFPLFKSSARNGQIRTVNDLV
ncbi:Rid family hydrolase [Microvirga mediterraneensis]|uniref:Rid family hydrolase n=1 Tax=Microvirga mediterraneensis TaxID=2754695 RepID=UPI001920B286